MFIGQSRITPMPYIKTIHDPVLIWENVYKPGKKEVEYLKKNYLFEEQDLQDCLPPLQRAKTIERKNYVFIILQFPHYHKKKREVVSVELDIFIRNNLLVTAHSDELNVLTKLFKECKEDTDTRRKIFGTTPLHLLHNILDKLLEEAMPLLNNISLTIEMVERKIFQTPPNPTTIKDLLELKRNVVNFRKTMQAHKSVLERLIPASQRILPGKQNHVYLRNLVNHTIEIWTTLENYKDTVNALHETNESLAAHRLNNIMKTLTIFSVIVFPLTLLAAIFGMNTKVMPFVDDPNGFWIILSIMLFGTIGMFGYFKRKKWI